MPQDFNEQREGDFLTVLAFLTTPRGHGLDIDEKLASVLFRHDKSEANEGGHPHMTQLANRPSLVSRSTRYLCGIRFSHNINRGLGNDRNWAEMGIRSRQEPNQTWVLVQ